MAFWIWHKDEYEIYHHMQIHLRREVRGCGYPSMWNTATPYLAVNFYKSFDAEKDGYLLPVLNGEGFLRMDGVMYPSGERVFVSRGHHDIDVRVLNRTGLPALFVESDICPTDGSWYADHCAGERKPVGWLGELTDPAVSPECFPFAYEPLSPVSSRRVEGGALYDFGKETFGYLLLAGADPAARLCVYYGESEEEALDTENAQLTETVTGAASYRLRQRAFRFVRVTGGDAEVSALYEYLPLTEKGTFRCDRELFNRIRELCVYTFHLNCRECFLDGIKRDRWVWSGDAYQSQRINTYLFADKAIEQRTAIGLEGKPPVEQHINTILDYSLLWVIGIWEHTVVYGDMDYLAHIYDRALGRMAFCESRLNADGFLEGGDGDWTFIDWSPMDKTGAISAEQVLLVEAYRAMARICRALGKSDAEWEEKAQKLWARVNEYYWDEEKGALIDSYVSGKRNVTRHANIFAVMYGLTTPAQTESIRERVIKNDAITKITTPYFEGYELDVLGKLGEFEAIESMISSYWGGMLALGATTVWEEYDPRLEGAAHYGMYGEKYGKSLCHAWGAGPVYLFGRYYLGVYATDVGGRAFRVEPQLGGLGWIEGTVAMADGSVSVKADKSGATVLSTVSGGTLLWEGKEYPLPVGEALRVGKAQL